MWKSDKHLVQGVIQLDRVELGSLTCLATGKTEFDFTRHHAVFAEFEVSCPQCGIDEHFTQKNIITDDGA